MTKRRFTKPPSYGTGSRASDQVAPGELAPEVREFKNVYVHERRLLERFRQGSEAQPYQPAASLDGKSRFDTPEERIGVNQWKVCWDRLDKAQNQISPSQYVRVLFRILRGTSLAVPTLLQLATAPTLELVKEYLKDNEMDFRQQFIAETQRARSSIVISQKGSGYSLALSVYYAIVDPRLELSPLFKYCLAATTSEHLRRVGILDAHCEKLDTLAKQFEFLAAMDYTLFPDLYNRVWGKVIPAEFRVAASSLLRAALQQ